MNCWFWLPLTWGGFGQPSRCSQFMVWDKHEKLKCLFLMEFKCTMLPHYDKGSLGEHPRGAPLTVGN